VRHKRKQGLLAAAAITAVLIGSVPGEAATKRQGFFDRLFSTSSKQKKPPLVKRKSTTFYSWFSPRKDVNVTYKSNFNPDTDVDPEPFPTKGLGNVEYTPPKALALYDGKTSKTELSSPQNEGIRQIFLDRKSGYRINSNERDAIITHYKARGYQPQWLSGGKPTAQAEAILKLLSQANQHGLTPENYMPAGLSDFSDSVESVTSDATVAARIDVGLTVAALTYARHLHSGQFEPNALSLYNDLSPEKIAPADIMRVLAYSPYPDQYLQSLEPKHPSYAVLKAQLVKVEQERASGSYVPFPATGQRVRAGQRDERVPELRLRMLELGFIEPGDAFVPADNSELLDKKLSAALKKFQVSAKIKQTGNLDKATENALNANPAERERDQLVVNMERIRWLPKDLGDRHVFVNQPAFEVVVKDNNRTVWESKVIVGRPMTQTSVFSDKFEQVVFNPSWGVPQSIIVNEYLPKLRRDPGYLDRIGFKVTTSSGEKVSSRSVNWRAYGNKVPLSVQQPPGGENALGEIKFLFPNSHDIYMHDTPTRNLFGETMRAFSHGCVRVENPRDFATVLLGWGRDEIDNRVDSGESTTVKVSSGYRVHLQYLTAWPDSTGTVKYYEDIYGRDEAMLKAIAASTRKRQTLVSLGSNTSGSKAVEFD
jgi:L,D-transpeptidase YcbB